MIAVLAVLAALGVVAAAALHLITKRARRTQLRYEARLASASTSELAAEALAVCTRIGLMDLEATKQLARGVHTDGELLAVLEAIVVEGSAAQPPREVGDARETLLFQLFDDGYMSIVEIVRRRTSS